MNSSKATPSTISVAQACGLPNDQKCEYFHHVHINHPRIASTMRELETVASPHSGTDIALVIGPSGVGKTCLCESITERVIKNHRAEIEQDPSYIPIVHVQAPSSGEIKFAWRTFYAEIGHALNEPLMHKKILDVTEDGRHTVKPVTMGSTVAAMRMAVEKALKARRTRIMVVDEAAVLMRSAKGDKLEAHIHALRSLANICGLTLVLAGSYDLYDLICLDGQLARRSAIIHFGRYQSGVAEDEKAFRLSIASLQKYLPIQDLPDLTNYAPELMRSCIGCVGSLKETLERTLIRVTENKGVWTPNCLERALLPEKQNGRILEETLAGERDIQSAIYGSGVLASTPAKRRGAA